MSDKQEMAKLILRLYDLRREARIREARDWVSSFNPKTLEDVEAAVNGPDHGKLTMVIGFWEMVAALVNNGAIDKKMYADTNHEHLFLFAKLEPFLKEMRKHDPHMLMQNEKLIMAMPNAKKMLASMRKMKE